jgi:hypothetical protein
MPCPYEGVFKIMRYRTSEVIASSYAKDSNTLFNLFAPFVPPDQLEYFLSNLSMYRDPGFRDKKHREKGQEVGHHIIPLDLCRTHKLMLEGYEYGFDQEDEKNLRILPKHLHNTNHPEYTELVKNILDRYLIELEEEDGMCQKAVLLAIDYTLLECCLFLDKKVRLDLPLT